MPLGWITIHFVHPWDPMKLLWASERRQDLPHLPSAYSVSVAFQEFQNENRTDHDSRDQPPPLPWAYCFQSHFQTCQNEDKNHERMPSPLEISPICPGHTVFSRILQHFRTKPKGECHPHDSRDVTHLPCAYCFQSHFKHFRTKAMRPPCGPDDLPHLPQLPHMPCAYCFQSHFPAFQNEGNAALMISPISPTCPVRRLMHIASSDVELSVSRSKPYRVGYEERTCAGKILGIWSCKLLALRRPLCKALISLTAFSRIFEMQGAHCLDCRV